MTISTSSTRQRTPAAEPAPVDDDTLTFDRLRPRLHGIAYRMLGATAEAEEVVQDAWLRWHDADRATIANVEAWLVTITTRLAIDRLRAAKLQRAHYAGYWLPEPLLADAPRSPDQILEHADDLSVAFLTLLERLSPESRAAFLMREVFDADYDDLARTLGKSPAACRQMVSRAKAQLREARPRYAVAPEAHLRAMRQFADALTAGDFAALKAMLADDAELVSDGGGIVPSFGKPLRGSQRIAQLFYASQLRAKDALRVELAWFNGQWGLLRFVDGVLESAQYVETDGQRVVRIHVQRNPDKLARLAAAQTVD